ncbi:MAG: hypothetical protein OEY28_00085 [Nitrospira sp.]|nr:hypothetical protein [Nitrospira sp.]
MTEIVLRNKDDVIQWLKPGQWKRYLDTLPRSARFQQDAAMLAGTMALPLSVVERALNEESLRQQSALQAQGVYVAPQDSTARTFEEVNEINAAEIAAQWPLQSLREFVGGYGAKPELPEHDARAVATVVLYQLANAAGKLINVTWNGGEISAVTFTDYALGAGKSFGEQLRQFVRHPLKVLQRVFITEPAKALRVTGAEILRGRRNVPFLGKYFLDPLGFSAQAVLLEQIGIAGVEGSITAFDERKVARAAALTMRAAGDALLKAAPLLPPPWNVAAAAVGGLSIAAGRTLDAVYNKAENERQIEAAKAQAAAMQAQQAQQAQAEPAPAQARQDRVVRANWPRYGALWTTISSLDGGAAWFARAVFDAARKVWVNISPVPVAVA